jgi:hypothetical protein
MAGTRNTASKSEEPPVEDGEPEVVEDEEEEDDDEDVPEEEFEVDKVLDHRKDEGPVCTQLCMISS